MKFVKQYFWIQLYEIGALCQLPLDIFWKFPLISELLIGKISKVFTRSENSLLSVGPCFIKQGVASCLYHDWFWLVENRRITNSSNRLKKTRRLKYLIQNFTCLLLNFLDDKTAPFKWAGDNWRIFLKRKHTVLSRILMTTTKW